MEVKGKITEIGALQNVTDKLKKRDLILEYIENPQYPEYLKFESIGDKTKLLDNLKVGQDVEVFFNLKGRPWTDKTGKKTYFNSLQLWKINVLSGSSTPEYIAPPELSYKSQEDDLPF